MSDASLPAARGDGLGAVRLGRRGERQGAGAVGEGAGGVQQRPLGRLGGDPGRAL